MEKKHASDQRLAELQALIALSDGRHNVYAHGQVNPFFELVTVTVTVATPIFYFSSSSYI